LVCHFPDVWIKRTIFNAQVMMVPKCHGQFCGIFIKCSVLKFKFSIVTL